MAQIGNGRNRIWNFGRVEYWDGRYKQRLQEQADVFNERTFDWLCTYEAICKHIDPYIRDSYVALDIGCGNADFAAAVSAAHPTLHIIGIDYSSSLFELCGSSLGPSHRTGWLVMDARFLALRDSSFDVILDKGCLDAMCAGYDQIALLRSWGREITQEEDELTDAAVKSVRKLLREVERCLVPGGRYICISYEGLAGRQQLFTSTQEAGLRLTLVQTAVEEESHNHVYIFVKGPVPPTLTMLKALPGANAGGSDGNMDTAAIAISIPGVHEATDAQAPVASGAAGDRTDLIQ
ncbi:hypothetical protein Vretifemale_11327 [Volvox reticuliferus]|uniref:Methyltransferase domain-containing protein n=2 Tax=Volvox reticuliferus TaxID=1737510 RepID=A0A8J4CM28_9CHLO|nr:hypothetical protein Vretifemale_11327 [Volvox reticuliferus]